MVNFTFICMIMFHLKKQQLYFLMCFWVIIKDLVLCLSVQWKAFKSL